MKVLWSDWLPPTATAAHVKFGSVLGADGKILRTRDGVELKLIDLLTEAVQRAHQVIAERSELDPAEQQRIARAVGVGAVKYADLSTHRDKDYVVDWDRMLAMDGNTAVYLQYAHARIRSMLRKSGRPIALDGAVVITAPAERDLALKLTHYPTAVQAAAQHHEPHALCGYLYDLATAFSGFYENCPSSPPPRNSSATPDSPSPTTPPAPSPTACNCSASTHRNGSKPPTLRRR